MTAIDAVAVIMLLTAMSGMFGANNLESDEEHVTCFICAFSRKHQELEIEIDPEVEIKTQNSDPRGQ